MQLLLSKDLIDLKRLAQKYHYQDEDMEQLDALWQEVHFCMTRSAVEVNSSSDGRNEKSHMMEWAIEVVHRAVSKEEVAWLPTERAELMAMTLGSEVDARQEIYLKNENLTAAYMMECICNEVLLKLYQQLNRQYALTYGSYIKRYHFIGEKIPMEEMPRVLAMLEQEQITCNAYGALNPKKSVVFLAQMTEKKEEECQGICRYCTRKDCPNKSQEGFHLTYGFQKIFGGI